MKHKVTPWVVLLLALVPLVAAAQDVNVQRTGASNLAPIIPGPPGACPAGEATVHGPNVFGNGHQVTWFAASKFTVAVSSTAPTLSYSSFHYFHSNGSASPTRYFAQLDLDPGARVDVLTPVYIDNSATNDVSWSLQEYVDNVATGGNVSINLYGQGNTTGTPGGSFTNSGVPNVVISTLNGVNLTSYLLAIDVSSDTSFAGMWVGWHRIVSPAPASATFTDVPTTSGQFRFVEALVAAGITAGCGGGNYCPNDPVTRGQMAVFLASALGLNFIQ